LLSGNHKMQRSVLVSVALALVAAASAFTPAALPALRSPALRARGMCSLKMQDDSGPAGNAKRVGASIDADGKSNVWAVEPKMQVFPSPKSSRFLQKSPTCQQKSLQFPHKSSYFCKRALYVR